MKSILVALDLHPSGSNVLQTARKTASAFGAKLYVVHSEIVGSQYLNKVSQQSGDQSLLEIVSEQDKLIKEKLSEIHRSLKKANIESDCIYMEGPTVENILTEAEKVNAELIIMGSHKHGKFYNFLFGSIHELLICKAKIPIMIVPKIETE